MLKTLYKAGRSAPTVSADFFVPGVLRLGVSYPYRIIDIRGYKVILDSDVALLYEVETKQINQAVKNNPDKFPAGYLIELTEIEKWEVVKNLVHLQKLKFSPNLPKAFTEKGLYMLATILKSPIATQTTLAIIDTFAKVREMKQIMSQLPHVKENSPEYQTMVHKTGEMLSDLVIPDYAEVNEEMASVEFNLAVVKFKYSIKKKTKGKNVNN